MVACVPRVGIRAIKSQIPVCVVGQGRSVEACHSVVRVKGVVAYGVREAGGRQRACFARHSSVRIVAVDQVSQLRTPRSVRQTGNARVVVDTISDRHPIGQTVARVPGVVDDALVLAAALAEPGDIYNSSLNSVDRPKKVPIR
jgi:hypothetical protein